MFYIFVNKTTCMKKIVLALALVLSIQNSFGQLKTRYGITAGLNVSSAILPELKLNSLNNILHGEDVVKGQAQLADYVSLYKLGFFYKIDGRIGAIKFNANYTSTNIHKDIETLLGDVNVLNINLSYLDFDITYNLNLSKHFYFSAGYVPSLLLDHNGNLDINGFDQRIVSGFGFRFANGASIDLDAVVGIYEIINGSYIHNVMIPVTVSIPLKY